MTAFDLSSDSGAEALRIINRLRDAGFVAYLAGGCVRDALLGKVPKDYDVATDATPEAIRKLFTPRQTLAFGASFGVIGVLPERENRHRNRQPTEVATFRSDGSYSDGRRPDSVHFGTAQADAQRRDFTINGLFYDPQAGAVIDFVGGQQDLQQRVLRTIGNPLQRFDEDKLRMLRAVRFTTTLGFDVHYETAQAIRDHASGITLVSGERVGVEMRRTLTSGNALTGLMHLQSLSLSSYVLPELDDVDLNWLKRLFRHPSLTRDNSPQDETLPSFPVALACVLIASRRPEENLRAIANRWRLSNEEVRMTLAAIRFATVLSEAHTRRWSEVQPVLVDRDASIIFELAKRIVSANRIDHPETSDAGMRLVEEAFSWPQNRLNPPPLLSGNDLAAIIAPGPQFATILREVRVRQLDNQLQTRSEAVEFVNQHFAK